jgi:hypothetical protein
MSRRGIAYHSVALLTKHGYSIEAVKAWRTRESEAGRPSGLDDFYRAHGLCVECRGNGNKLLGCRWWDARGKERKRLLRTGVTVATLVERYLKDAERWEYWLEPCEACGGTGKSKAP